MTASKSCQSADHLLGAERLEGQLAAALLDDAVGPVLEKLEPDAAGPRGLDLPRRGRGLGGADVWGAKLAGGAQYGCRAADCGGALEQAATGERLRRPCGLCSNIGFAHDQSSHTICRRADAVTLRLAPVAPLRAERRVILTRITQMIM